MNASNFYSTILTEAVVRVVVQETCFRKSAEFKNSAIYANKNLK